MKERNFHDFLTRRSRKNGSRLVFQKKDGWSWKQVTWPDLLTEVESIVCFLINSGFTSGSRIVVLSPNTLECLFFELAVLMIGGTSLPVGSAEEARETLENSPESCFFLSGSPELARELASCPRGEKKIEKAFLTVDAKISVEEKTVSYANVVKFGFLSRKKLKDEIDAIGSSVKESSPAVIFNTRNGLGDTTDFSQGDILDLLRLWEETLGTVSSEDQTFSYLPRCNSFSKFANLINLQTAARGATAPRAEDFFSDVLEIMPVTLFLGRNEIETAVKRLRGENGSAGSLKSGLGGRARLILTDAEPGEKTTDILLEEGISAVTLGSPSAVS